MRFTDPGFLFLFLPGVFGVYYLFLRRRQDAANAFLTAASILFYAWGEPVFVLVLLFSVILNHTFAVCLDRLTGKGRRRKRAFFAQPCISRFFPS